MLPSSRVFAQLLLACSNKFFSRPCGTSSEGSSIKVASAREDVTTCNNMPSKADMALERQATEIDLNLLCLQVPNNHFQDHAFTDACKQGGDMSSQFKISPKTLPSTFPTSNHKGPTFSDHNHGLMHGWMKLTMGMPLIYHHLMPVPWSLPRFPLPGATTLPVLLMHLLVMTPSPLSPH